MNERIKQLSDIAYKNHLARNPNSSFGRRSDYDTEFAELIVRECQFAIVSRTDLPKHERKLYNNVLKEHFGVEE